ncbi:MAG: NAD-dependent epimerase/dehydratase family protein [Phycisphaerales bacterium]|nr:NAD-dependent epimerase/dehydratase family protein [Phycisphaerales bacterium]
MKLLILGGTIFVGRHLVKMAVARGHDLTLFNRGEHNPGLFPDVETIHGDRDGGLDALRDGCWDAVIDTCGYVPRIARASAELLADRTAHYTFISSISVYADASIRRMDESAPVGVLDDPTVEEITGETYGPLKALCEQAVERALPGRSLVVRPGLIVGRHDPSDRFTYWPVRVARGGDVLVPPDLDMPVQFIHARDLADWIIRSIETNVTGVFNAVGPALPMTLGAFLEYCRSATESDARFIPVSEAFMTEHGVEYWSDLPMCVPPGDMGMNDADCGKAIEARLALNPTTWIIRDTLAWRRETLADRPLTTGLTGEREAELLDAWNAAR